VWSSEPPGFALTAVVALGLGIAGAGVFGVCMALSMVLTQVGKLGYDTALVHLLPRLHLYGGADQTRPLIRRATRVTVTVGVRADSPRPRGERAPG
jgi:hypothetical protein